MTHLEETGSDGTKTTREPKSFKFYGLFLPKEKHCDKNKNKHEYSKIENVKASLEAGGNNRFTERELLKTTLYDGKV